MLTDKEIKENFKKRHPHYMRDYTRDLRNQALEMLGKRCVNCGCDDIKLLEINHKVIGKENKLKLHGKWHLGSSSFLLAIIKGRIPLTEFETTCRVCNALHYCQKRFGDSNHKVIWEGGKVACNS